MSTLCTAIPSNTVAASTLEVIRATTPLQREACFRIRAKAFLANWDESEANDVLLTDSVDERAVLLLALRDGAPIGSVRVLCGDLSQAPDRNLYGLDELEREFPGEVAVHSKLAVLPEHRRGRTMLLLTQASFRTALEEGALISLIGCRNELLPMYEKLGFRQYREARDVPGHGPILPLRLDNYDEASLSAIRSPWLPILQNFVRFGGLERSKN